MKILFITPRFPFPSDRGDRLRYFNFAKILAKKHSLHLLSFIESKKELDFDRNFKGIFDNIETVRLSTLRSYLNMVVLFYTLDNLDPLAIFEVIAKIENLDIDIVAVGHGPILDKDPWKIIKYTKELASITHKNEKPLIVIPYVTSYGYTEFLAKKIKEELSNEDFDVEIYNMTFSSIDDVMKRLIIADGILVGSPTILGDALLPIWQLLIRLNPFEHGIKKGSVFGSYGWSGEGINHVDIRLKQLKMKTIPPFKLKFKASKEDLEELTDYIQDFVRLMIK